ncbi:unnamed protein product, partial [Prorocentrum cordatum]
ELVDAEIAERLAAKALAREAGVGLAERGAAADGSMKTSDLTWDEESFRNIR